MFSELFQFYKLVDIKNLKELGKLFDDKGGDLNLSASRGIRSISSYSSGNIFYFPVVISDQCTLEEVKMISRALEKQYAAFVAACVSLVPFHKVDDNADIQSYLQTFHQNIGINQIDAAGAIFQLGKAMSESTMSAEDNAKADAEAERLWKMSLSKNESFVELSLKKFKSINESTDQRDHLDPYCRRLVARYKGELSKPNNENFTVDENYPSLKDMEKNQVFPDKEVFTNTDMKKANELLPTIIKANIGFIVGKEERVIKQEILIGIKTYIHKYSSKVLIEDLYQTIKTNRKFLQFVKFVTGEEKSLADLLFGMEKIKFDVSSAKKAGVGDAQIKMIKKRSRMKKLSVPMIMKNYTPNVSYVITSNEVGLLKSLYGVDILTGNSISKIMDENYMLGFVILDQMNESAFISYEGHNYQFQEYPYTYLEREAVESDRMMRQLYRDFSGRR